MQYALLPLCGVVFAKVPVGEQGLSRHDKIVKVAMQKP